MNRIILLIVILLLILGGVYLLLFVVSPNGQEQEVVNVTKTGEMVCLPRVDTQAPATLECALGIQVNDDTYYGLDMSGTDQNTTYDVGTEVSVEGGYTPYDALAANEKMRLYRIDGVIAVHSITPTNPAQTATENRQVLAGGDVAFLVPGDFGLATNPEQVLVESYIPPCAEGFSYCVYYNADMYTDTNFESAGMSVTERDDLTSTSTCLTTPPNGYDSFTASTSDAGVYQTSVFSPVSDAATGHVATGAVYRLAYKDTCYEFQTRLGTSQYANYEPGSITEFTPMDERVMEQKLQGVLDSVTFTKDGSPVQFP